MGDVFLISLARIQNTYRDSYIAIGSQYYLFFFLQNTGIIV